MKNTITVEIRFSYKGENYAPQATVELDEYLKNDQPIPAFFHLVARANNIDVYSYQYEVMEMGQYWFSNATGLAADFCTEGQFDVEGFSERWKQQRVYDELADIAQRYLSVEELTQHDDIYQALLAAYQKGREQGK